MSRQNKLRFLSFLLFSAVAHSGVLIASLLMKSPIQEDAQGSTQKLAVSAPADSNSPQVLVAQNSAQLPTVLPSKKKPTATTLELVDLPASTQSESIPEKKILLAQSDDPRAVEIEKPKVSRQALPAFIPKKKIAKQKAAKKIKKANPIPENLQENLTGEKPVVIKEKVDAEDSDVIVDEREPRIAVSAPAPKDIPVESEEEPVLQAQPVAASNSVESQIQGDGEGTEVSAGSSKGIRDGDSLAEINGNRRPGYPLEDRRAHREGVAVFIARVTADGRVADIKLESSATPAMNAAAQKAFANYKYRPGQEGWVRKKFVFKINGETEEAGGLRRSSQKTLEKNS